MVDVADVGTPSQPGDSLAAKQAPKPTALTILRFGFETSPASIADCQYCAMITANMLGPLNGIVETPAEFQVAEH